ncbi:hypothetical protein RchiOBHm_Chr2g0141281 [Rosa chinensis]|uniref:Uncharacterized protein n=1 Tax=Rosa chinensis TaxID=74649 RepID=A0A2P6RXJ1_ROSCH|nr:hypothetical protein RchiOBHm_Chr2g0141281 [Rosa chinensis]
MEKKKKTEWSNSPHFLPSQNLLTLSLSLSLSSQKLSDSLNPNHGRCSSSAAASLPSSSSSAGPPSTASSRLGAREFNHSRRSRASCFRRRRNHRLDCPRPRWSGRSKHLRGGRRPAIAWSLFTT